MFKFTIYLAILVAFQSVTGQCPPDGIGYLSHETLCNSYYFCTTGAPNLRVCPGNLHWDNERRACAHPDSFQCFLRDFRCPENTDPANLTYLANALDCRRFSICLNGVAYQQLCGGNNYWDPTLRACTTPESSSCTSTTTQPPSTTPVEVTCSSNTGLFFIPHPSRCEYYFVCSNGTPHFRTCAPGLFFDTPNEWCDLEENAVCSQDLTTMPPTTPVSTTTTTTSEPTTTTPTSPETPTTTPYPTTTTTTSPETPTTTPPETTTLPNSNNPDEIQTTGEGITTTNTPDVPTTEDPDDGGLSISSGCWNLVLGVVFMQIGVWFM